MGAIQLRDFLARRRVDGLYEICQHTYTGDVPLEGPYSRETAAVRLRARAEEHGSDSWIQQRDGRYRFLEPD